MTAVLVHGVPDTARLWDGVREHLSRNDVVAPSLPGFGNPRPEGFAATKEAYVDWLIREVEMVGGPVDIVGHDWGAILVARLVSVRPDLVRTWCVGDGPIDASYEWHPTAQIWQTPEMGEQFIAGWLAMPREDLVAGFVAAGIPADTAPEVAARLDDVMGVCILDLYRSAVTVGAEWEADTASVDRPGLIIWGEADPYVAVDVGRRQAERMHAEFLLLEGCGHWWPAQRPAEVAAALERFWSQAPPSP